MMSEDDSLAPAGKQDARRVPESTFTAIRDQLQTLKASMDAEIRNNPTSIAGCDQQLDFLLEQRDKVLHHLRRLDVLCQEGSVPDDFIEEIDAIISSSAYDKNSATTG